MPRRADVPSFAVLCLLAGVGPLATDMYLPALPGLRSDLGVGPAAAQATLTAFLVGLAAGQIFLGPFSDAFGRRPFTLAGPAVFAVTSLACALTASISLFIGARFVQGLAAAAGVVAARAVVSDHYRGDDAARRFGLLSAIALLSPVLAPVVGSVVLLVGSWRTMFAALTGVGLLQLVGALRGVPETLPAADRHPASPTATLRRMAALLGDLAFARHVLVMSLATVGFFGYIGASSFVLQDVYGLSASDYGAVFAVNATCMAATSAWFTQLVGRYRVTLLRGVGLAAAALGSTVLAVTAAVWPHHTPPLPLVLAALPAVTAGMGLVVPASTTLAQQAGHWARGTAAALTGGISFGCGAAVMPVTGAFTAAGALPMALTMAVFLALAAAIGVRGGHR